MNVVVDTNVFVSAVFFGGVPGRILDFWKRGQMDLLMSEQILSEYVDVLRRLAARYPRVDPVDEQEHPGWSYDNESRRQ